jgi:hypothetical protein
MSSMSRDVVDDLAPTGLLRASINQPDAAVARRLGL